MTSAPDHQFHEEDAERLLGALAGVVSAHIVTDGVGRMVEIHILATPDFHPKQVVRNVESALSAGLGIEVDRRIVSVAQIRTETAGSAESAVTPAPDTPPIEGWTGERPDDSADRTTSEGSDSGAPSETPVPRQAPDRLQYVRYEARRDAGRCNCRVVLRAPAEEVTGTGAGPDTVTGRAEAAARAVFDALGRVRTELRIELAGAVISESRDRSFVIVSAHVLLDRETVPLAGAAALTRSPEEAAILAALQASNRWSG